MFRTAVTSTRSALLRAQCSCSYRHNAILKRHASRLKDVDPDPPILIPRKRTRASRSKEADPDTPLFRKRRAPSTRERYLTPVPASADDLPSIPVADERVLFDTTDTEASALLSSITSAPKEKSKLDKTNDAAICKKLKKAYGILPKKGGMRNDKRRVNLISSSLCDDIVERLKPSLEEYKGCDIIDINPGAGLFSSKLHNLIKPRSHILMEPDQGTYSQFLQPLVDEPGSTYSLVPKSGIIWSELETIMNKEYLPHQEAYPASDPRLCEINKTLLVVANLAYHPEKPYKGFSSLTRMVLYQFLSAVKANSLFHRYGMVRMLLWVGDDERTKIIPRGLGSRRKAAVEMEITCSKVNEIASSTKAAVIKRFHRDPRLDFKALPQIVKRMQEKGFTIPVGRESLLIAEWAEGSSKTISAHRGRSTAILRELGENIRADWDRMNNDERREKFRLYIAKRSNITTHQRKREALHQLVDLDRAMVALEKKLYKNMDSVEVNKLESECARLAEEIEEIRDAHVNTNDHNELTITIDNSRIFHDQLLLWDRRDFEPLRAQADEFYPAKEIALLDLEPRSWPVLRENYPESDEVLEFILAHLFLQPTSSLKFGLTSLWPGAFDWFIEHCPSLTDPNKGGWKDLEKVPARRISPEMLQEILEVWFEWPWRPSRFDIMNRLGSVNFDPDAVEPDD